MNVRVLKQVKNYSVRDPTSFPPQADNYLTWTADLVDTLGVADGLALLLAEGLGLKLGLILGEAVTSMLAAGANWLVYRLLNQTK